MVERDNIWSTYNEERPYSFPTLRKAPIKIANTQFNLPWVAWEDWFEIERGGAERIIWQIY
jgi:hypothetical protein